MTVQGVGEVFRQAMGEEVADPLALDARLPCVAHEVELLIRRTHGSTQGLWPSVLLGGGPQQGPGFVFVFWLVVPSSATPMTSRAVFQACQSRGQALFHVRIGLEPESGSFKQITVKSRRISWQGC